MSICTFMGVTKIYAHPRPASIINCLVGSGSQSQMHMNRYDIKMTIVVHMFHATRQYSYIRFPRIQLTIPTLGHGLARSLSSPLHARRVDLRRLRNEAFASWLADSASSANRVLSSHFLRRSVLLCFLHELLLNPSFMLSVAMAPFLLFPRYFVVVVMTVWWVMSLLLPGRCGARVVWAFLHCRAGSFLLPEGEEAQQYKLHVQPGELTARQLV